MTRKKRTIFLLLRHPFWDFLCNSSLTPPSISFSMHLFTNASATAEKWVRQWAREASRTARTFPPTAASLALRPLRFCLLRTTHLLLQILSDSQSAFAQPHQLILIPQLNSSFFPLLAVSLLVPFLRSYSVNLLRRTGFLIWFHFQFYNLLIIGFHSLNSARLASLLSCSQDGKRTGLSSWAKIFFLKILRKFYFHQDVSPIFIGDFWFLILLLWTFRNHKYFTLT